MPWVRPLFGDGALVWRDSALLEERHVVSTPEELDAVLPGRSLIAERAFDAAHAASEDARIRDNIERMAEEIRGPNLSRERAREIARGSAARVEHGSDRPTESRRR